MENAKAYKELRRGRLDPSLASRLSQILRACAAESLVSCRGIGLISAKIATFDAVR